MLETAELITNPSLPQVDSEGVPFAEATKLREDATYMKYYVFWSKFILIELIPYLAIIVMNIFLFLKITKSTRFRKRFQRHDEVMNEPTTMSSPPARYDKTNRHLDEVTEALELSDANDDEKDSPHHAIMRRYISSPIPYSISIQLYILACNLLLTYGCQQVVNGSEWAVPIPKEGVS